MPDNPLHDPEYTVVPDDEQLDRDDDGSRSTDALDEATGADDDDLDDYRIRDAAIWPGSE